MDNRNYKRSWNVLNWNIRGINSESKHNAIRQKIDESNCAIYFLQETKREHFDHSSIRTFAPKKFDKFVFSPSQGSSGGIIMGWNSSIFSGELIHTLRFALTVKFTSKHNNDTWLLTTVYGPYKGTERVEFVIGSTLCTSKMMRSR